jgi:aspartate/methionine/tyrosine aminotransferase
MPQPSNRIFGGETSFEVLARAKELERGGRRIIHVEIGEPDFNTPEPIIAAGIDALRRNRTKYGAAAGDLATRETIWADHADRTGDTTMGPDNVVIAAGAKPVIIASIIACCEPGQVVLVPDPGFPIYRSAAILAGGEPISYHLNAANGFLPDPEEIAFLLRTKSVGLIILNTPGNPTGAVIDRRRFEEIAFFARKFDVWILSDEVYDSLVFEPTTFVSASTIGDLADQRIIMNGASKRFSMTGWRMGWGLFPIELVGRVTRVMTNLHSCVPGFVQDATVAALTDPRIPPIVEGRRLEFMRRRDLAVEALNQVPDFTCLTPGGAFYVLPKFDFPGLTAKLLAAR